MSYVENQIDLFLPSFFKVWPFHDLPASLRTQVASKLQLRSFAPGEVIYSATELPSEVHCILEGRVRLLGTVPYENPTLAVIGKGSVVGWDSLIRRVAAGSIRAMLSTNPNDLGVLTLSLPADEFESLAIDYLIPALMQQISWIELFDILSRLFAEFPTRCSGTQLKELVQYIQQEQLAVVQSWYPGSTHALTTQLSEDRIWLISGGIPLNLPIGSPVSRLDQLKPLYPALFPVRLIGINRSVLEPFISGSFGLTSHADTIATSTRPSFLSSAPVAFEKSVPSTLTSSSSQLSPFNSAQDASSAYAAKVYPIQRAVSPDLTDDLIACFSMICEALQIPYRPSSLRRWLTPKAIDKFDQIDLCVRIAQALGLNAEVTQFTPTAGGLNRVKTPALIYYQNSLAVLYEVTPKMAILGSPRQGLLRLAPGVVAARLAAFASEHSLSSCQAVFIDRLPQSPIKRFGLRWFLPALKGQQGILFQVLVASVFVQVLSLANPLLVQQVIDKVIIAANPRAMPMFGILLILFAALEGVLTVLRTYLFANTTNRLDLRLGIEIIRHLLQLPLSFFEKRPVGELASRLSELENIRQFLTGTALTAVLDVLFSVIYIAVMLLYSVRLTVCVLLTIPIVVISMLLISAILQKLIRLKADHGAQVQSYLVEILSGMFTVKAQNMESLVEGTWRDRYVQYLMSGFTTSTISSIFAAFNHFLNTMSSFLVLWVGAELVAEGQLTLGGLIAFRILAGYVTGPFIRLSQLWQRFQETSLSMELLADVMDSATEELPQDAAHVQLPPVQGQIQYCDVSFGFKAGQKQVSKVSLDIPPGSFVGIVGQSGSGKSTLMKLLPRLYLPQDGNIYIDGYEISKVKLSSLRQQIGYVPQDAVLFEGTIRDNIALFGDLEDDAIIEAARVAEAHEFIMQLPQGYSTAVGERGNTLSGGQKQRIAIARVIANNPRLLIFDEATSALDYETERRVCENLMQRFQDRTVFFITHRLNAITQADWILLMQSGAIVEQGNHLELMGLRQLYYCLYMQQSKP